MEEKKEFEKAEVEEIRFEEDVITASNTTSGSTWGESAQGFEP